MLGEAVSKQTETMSVRVEVKLLNAVRKQFPVATKKMSAAMLVDFGLRKLLEMNKNG